MDLCKWIYETPFDPEKPPIEFQKDIISKTILDKGRYVSENVIIQRNINGEDPNYISKINTNANFYIGELDKKEFKRNGIGINYYSNFDLYIGNFNNNMRNGHGIYFYKPEINDSIQRVKREVFFGYWKNNLIGDHGVYYWIDEPLNVAGNNFNKTNFKCFIGNFEKEEFKRGVLLEKEKNNYSVFYGDFPNDNNRFLCTTNDENELVINGVYKDKKFENGYIIYNNDEGICQKIVNFEKKDDGLTHFVSNKFNEDDKKKVIEESSNFRNILMGADYFNDAYNKYLICKNYASNEQFNDPDYFSNQKSELFYSLSSYNKLKLFKLLESFFKKKK